MAINDLAEAVETHSEIARLKARLERETNRRIEAEALADKECRALHDKQSELSLLATIARASNEANTLASAFFAAIRGICHFTGWDVGHSYLVDSRSHPPKITAMGIWFMSDPMRFTPFRVATESIHFSTTCEVAGRIHASGKPLFFENLDVVSDFSRQDSAMICGLKSGYAIPVLTAQRTTAVLEFYSSAPIGANEPFFEIAAQISAQLGRVVERHWSERTLRVAQVELEKKVDERTRELATSIDELNRHIDEQRKIQHVLQVRDKAMSSVANGIVITDATGTDNPMIYCNPAFESLTGYTFAEIVGKNCRFLQGPDTDPVAIATLRAAIREGGRCEVTLKNYKKNGDSFWNKLTLSPVRNAAGTLTHFVGVQEDVTEQRRSVEMMRAAKEATDCANAELERAARLKDEFLAAMSHELRTPLNGILGLSEAIQENIYGDINDRQRTALTSIEESGRHLLALINDILDLSKIEAGKLEVDIGPVDPGIVAQSCLRFIREMAQKKLLKTSLNLDADTPLVMADQRRLKQMLVNLLSNAVKFTPEGGQIGLEVAQDPDSNSVNFTVWDTGIGIAQDDIPKLFKPFVQIDSRLSRRFEGTGLGLALVRLMAELQEGRVSLSSTQGVGSRFTITIPAAAGTVQPSSSKEPISRPAMPPLTAPSNANQGVILIAEDNETNLRTFYDFLSSRGYRLQVARDGDEVMKQVRQQKPNLVLMDIQMPGVDGITAIKRLRSIAEYSDIPIVALTALAMPGDRERCMEAGADDYLSKPIGLRALDEAVKSRILRP